MTELIINDVDKVVSYDWLDQISHINQQIIIISDKNFNVEFISEYTRDLLELDFNLSELPHPLPYELVLTSLIEKGYFGESTTAEIVDQLMKKTEINDSAAPRPFEKLNLFTPSGRHIQIKQSVSSDERLFLTGDDITTDYVEKHALKLALDSSQSGYGTYRRETGQLVIHGDVIRHHFRTDASGNLNMQEFEQLIHPDDNAKSKLTWKKGIKSQKPWEVTYRVRGDNGRSVWLKSHFIPQPSKDGEITRVTCFFTDVTNIIRVQNELRQVTENTQNTLKAKNNFIGRLSHEMRTPMNAVIGISDALIHHHNNPEINPKLELIQTSAEKIIRILDETLQHAKLEEHKLELNPRVTSPRKCVETLCQLWHEKAKTSNINLSCQIDANVPEQMHFDDFRFEQCLNNLLSNAIKFTAGGEIIVIQTLVEKAGQSFLVTAVKDNGIGMTKAQQSNIFEAFTQADKTISGRYGGTGLGMSITKNIIELMGGRITLDSTPGQGSIFALSLPIKTQNSDDSTKKEKLINRSLVEKLLKDNAPKSSEYDNLRVLVVDDNPTNHLVVKSLLGSLVKEIVTANNGVEGIQALEAQEFDLVLMDIHMPVMDGIEATLAIRGCDEFFANVPIIALTADPQYQQQRLCKNIGMNGTLGKPVKLSEILSEIDKVVLKAPFVTQEDQYVA
ncbi:MAG: ATP-binding protein [Litorimonas sp.]